MTDKTCRCGNPKNPGTIVCDDCTREAEFVAAQRNRNAEVLARSELAQELNKLTKDQRSDMLYFLAGYMPEAARSAVEEAHRQAAALDARRGYDLAAFTQAWEDDRANRAAKTPKGTE